MFDRICRINKIGSKLKSTIKLFSWKTGLILSLALCFLIFGSIILFRQKRATAQPEPKRYPHEHLQTSALEPRAKLHLVDYTLRQGETLAGVAKLRYGHQNYYPVIKLYNHFDDERQIAANYKLRLPEMSVILAEEGLTKVAAQEVALILCSRARYDKVVDQLWALFELRRLRHSICLLHGKSLQNGQPGSGNCQLYCLQRLAGHGCRNIRLVLRLLLRQFEEEFTYASVYPQKTNHDGFGSGNLRPCPCNGAS